MDWIDNPLFSDDEIFAYFIDGFDEDLDEDLDVADPPRPLPPGLEERYRFLQEILVELRNLEQAD